MEFLNYEAQDGIAVVTINRPKVMNALNSQLRAELVEAIEKGGKEARVVVLKGDARAFCTGQDLTDMSGADKGMQATLKEEYEPILHAIISGPVPVIAAVEGVAAGAGANIALAADVVVASETATFLQAFARIGLIPDAGGTYSLPRHMGTARAMGAALFAEPISGKQAAEWGMIWEAVPPEKFDTQWRMRARQLADGPTGTYKHIRDAIRSSFDNSLQSQLDVESNLQELASKAEYFAEGVAAFLQKRVANFTKK